MAEQTRDVFAEAKGYGFDIKIIRQILKLRKMEPGDRQEQEELLDVYMHALGMVPTGAHKEEDTTDTDTSMAA